MPGHEEQQQDFESRLKRTRILFWLLMLVAGAVQTWHVRYTIFTDGISYLDIADHYARGDWTHAINAYWSPFVSWLLAVVDVVFRPSGSWSVPCLHLVNYAAYLVGVVGLELFTGELIRFQGRGSSVERLSETTLRVSGYVCYLFAGLLLIGIGYCSPDMIAMAVVLFTSYLMLRIANGRARMSTYIWLGLSLAVGYLARSAFASIAALYFVSACILVRARAANVFRAALTMLAPAIVLAAPFVGAMSIQQGRFTLGETGKPNYAWEVDGAARFTHWQGEPGDIGKPLHPSHQVLVHPATYTFAQPVPGAYPPWYDPSYWYAGVKPRLKAAAQLNVIAKGMLLFAYLFLRSPAAPPWLVLVLLMGVRAWLSRDGILGSWFLWLPVLAYVGIYVLVFMDERYIAGSLVVLWLTLLASVSVTRRAKRYANAWVTGFVVVCGIWLFAFRLAPEAKAAWRDVTDSRHAPVDVPWLLAQRFRELGLRPGDKVAFIGISIDQNWTRLDGVQIVAEVPVVYDRQLGVMRRVIVNRTEINAFWSSPAARQAQVFDAFRRAGAVMVVADSIPSRANHSGWRRVLNDDELHLPADYPQDFAAYAVYRWLTPR